VTIADFFVDDEADIDSEGFTRICHGIFDFGLSQLADGISGASSLTPKFRPFYQQ
jgi:hypothetical protein